MFGRLFKLNLLIIENGLINYVLLVVTSVHTGLAYRTLVCWKGAYCPFAGCFTCLCRCRF